MATPASPPSLTIVAGDVESTTVTTRLIIPSSSRATWPPFVRVGETLANRFRTFPVHSHEHHEVLTYVSEGFASYSLEGHPDDMLRPGSARFLVSPSRSTHSISPAKGGPVRWFSLVVTLPPAVSGKPWLQASESPSTPIYEGDAWIRPLVGTGAPMRSETALECRDISFTEKSTTFQRVGHGRRGIVYALAGRGTVDGNGLESGEAALVEGVAGIAIQGTETLRVIVATVPR